MSDPSPVGRSAGHRTTTGTPVTALAAVVGCALACLGLVLAAPAGARGWVLAVSVAYGVLLSAAAGWSAVLARRGQGARGEVRAADARSRELLSRVAQSEAHTADAERRAGQAGAATEATRVELGRVTQESQRLLVRLAESGADAARLADEAIPVLVEQLVAGVPADMAVTAVPPLTEGAHRRALQAFADTVARGARRRAATLAACASAAGRVQALSTSVLADLREMENRYGQDVLGDLLRLDHATAQVGRLADSIAVLTGSRSGRRWTKPIVMESILRGAMGRISAYQRVRLHSTSSVAVAGHAAEGVMHALAELMDNATKFSPPTEMVHVYVEELTTGVMVTVEDAGLVMSPAALRRAQHAVSNDPLDLGTLSGTRLGLAVVGGLARKHGLTVSFRPSSRGGTGVLTLIPQQLITRRRTGEDGPGAGQWRTAVPAQGTGTAGRAPALPTRQPFWTEAPRHAIGPAPDEEPPAGDGADFTEPAGPSQEVTAPVSDEMSTPASEDPSAPASEEASAPPDAEVFVLPKRVRGQTMADAAGRQGPPAAAPAQPPASRGDDLGARFGAFVAASRRRAEDRRSDPAAPAGDDGP